METLTRTEVKREGREEVRGDGKGGMEGEQEREGKERRKVCNCIGRPGML